MNNLVRFKYGENNINTGPLKEIPEICVDHYVGNDLKSSIFFLSHAHTDHLVGLETDEFLRRLNQPGVKLYCHLLTPILLGSFERYLGGREGIKHLISKRKIIPLEIENPEVIVIPRLSGNVNVKVTLLPAGHCPGSVMFLFETSQLRILHTGDFRLTLDDLKRMPDLHFNKKPKPIDHLYVDTTFCSKAANLFPNRKSVLQDAIQRIRSWVSLSKEHIVYISFSAKFAHEYVLLELYKIFNQKIHVTKDRRDIYRNIPDLFKIVTLDDDTQFHLCQKRDCTSQGNAITLRLSSMWYTKGVGEDRDTVKWNGNFLTLCYSMHSSLQEIGMMVDYLKPTIVTPLVLPKNSDVSEIQDALKLVTSHYNFEFADYNSGRDDFNGIDSISEPCREERDETDLNEEQEQQNDDNLSEPAINNSQDSLSPSPKKFKPSWNSNTIWQYSLSPSSKSSQSSTDFSDGSQELVPEEKCENKVVQSDSKDSFVIPGPVSGSSSTGVRRNLMYVMPDVPPSDNDGETNFPLNSINISDGCSSSSVLDSKSNNDDILNDSQKLV